MTVYIPAFPFLLAGIFIVLFSQACPVPATAPTALEMTVKRLKIEEGFRAHAYRDTRGVLTIGYGTNLDEGITINEADLLLWNRLELKERDFSSAWPPYSKQPVTVQSELLDMAYQEGVRHLGEFHKMLAALERGDYEVAAQEALDSIWASETPSRAKTAAKIFRDQIK